ncbi:MAG: hypothetical protein ABR957_18900 [Terracidiphilus sp.]|jgi:hypothetical protein
MRFPSRLTLPLVATLFLGTTTTWASGPPAAAKPAQNLTRYIFPDGSGSMGLPPGWTVISAQLGDVIA